jgi:hypothetical protein
MNNCNISLDNFLIENYRKVPCILVMDEAQLTMNGCKLKGDAENETSTAGLVAINS